MFFFGLSLFLIFGWSKDAGAFAQTPVFGADYVANQHLCPNPHCISTSEDVDQLFVRKGNQLRCAYCESLPR